MMRNTTAAVCICCPLAELFACNVFLFPARAKELHFFREGKGCIYSVAVLHRDTRVLLCP